ncbi:hypothetical protein [Bacillus sp. FSL W7-1334]|uniref:hypothetical protein n=1 Tax=Bacillus sp. FSL W7-1334 TaxID=2921703 RepID=UPI0030FC660E|nr:hypothetical protein [Bacillus cereus]
MDRIFWSLIGIILFLLGFVNLNQFYFLSILGSILVSFNITNLFINFIEEKLIVKKIKTNGVKKSFLELQLLDFYKR